MGRLEVKDCGHHRRCRWHRLRHQQVIIAEGAHVFMATSTTRRARRPESLVKAGGSDVPPLRRRWNRTADLIAAAAETGHLDILVNNAAIAIGGMPLHEMTDEQWHRLIAVNLTSVFRGTKYALPHMLRQKSGSVISMASAQGHIGLDGWTAYAGAKGAIMSMMRQLAVEFGPHNIRFNSISPGTINTPMNEKVVADLGPQVGRAWVKMHPLGRIGKPEEVAEAAVYLASDAAGFTTGTDLRVAGGLTAAPRYVPEFFTE